MTRTSRTNGLVLVVLTAAAVLACAGSLAAQPAPAPKPPATPAAKGPSATATVASPAVMKILQDLEAAGAKYRTIYSPLEYTFIEEALGDIERRTGRIYLQRGDVTKKEPDKFRIQFDTLKLGKAKTLKDRVDYAFDGQWLAVMKHRIKTLTRYQVAAKGQNVQPTKLGEGPMPLPFGQPVGEMLRRFSIRTRALKPGEPAGTRFLECRPLPNFKKSINFTRLEMWVNSGGLPVQIVSINRNDDRTTVVFSGIRTNAKLDPSYFALKCPLGWTQENRPLKAGADLSP